MAVAVAAATLRRCSCALRGLCWAGWTCWQAASGSSRPRQTPLVTAWISWTVGEVRKAGASLEDMAGALQYDPGLVGALGGVVSAIGDVAEAANYAGASGDVDNLSACVGNGLRRVCAELSDLYEVLAEVRDAVVHGPWQQQGEEGHGEGEEGAKGAEGEQGEEKQQGEEGQQAGGRG